MWQPALMNDSDRLLAASGITQLTRKQTLSYCIICLQHAWSWDVLWFTAHDSQTAGLPPWWEYCGSMKMREGCMHLRCEYTTHMTGQWLSRDWLGLIWKKVLEDNINIISALTNGKFLVSEHNREWLQLWWLGQLREMVACTFTHTRTHHWRNHWQAARHCWRI